MQQPFKKLSIIIPAYNEERTIDEILKRVANTQIGGIEKQVVVVNDASTDNTKEKTEAFKIAHPEVELLLVNNPFNMGKGASVKTGIRYVNGEYLLIQDADLEYDPEDYSLLLKPVFKGGADVVYGSRFVGSNPHRILFFWHRLGNQMLTFFSNMFTNLNLTDMETGYKLIRTELVKGMDIKEKSFGFEPEVTARLARIKGIRFYEVGISYYGRTYAEGKKIKWVDGVRALYCIIRYNLFR